VPPLFSRVIFRGPLHSSPRCFRPRVAHRGSSCEAVTARRAGCEEVRMGSRRGLRRRDPRTSDRGLQPSVQRLHFDLEGRFWYAPPPRGECWQLRRHDSIVPTSQAAVGQIESCSSGPSLRLRRAAQRLRLRPPPAAPMRAAVAQSRSCRDPPPVRLRSCRRAARSPVTQCSTRGPALART